MRIPKINHEIYLKEQGFANIVGLDEVGRGAWAGPLVAAAVCLPADHRLYQIRDSKLLNSKEREKLARKIIKYSKIGIGIVEPEKISQLGVSRATQLSFNLALDDLKIKSDYILVDTFKVENCEIPQKPIKKGDMVCASIAAASIVAKVTRDKLMRQLGRKYWQYGFAKNKGYGTKQHQEALKKYGPSEVHRTNYRPIKEIKIQNPTRAEAREHANS